MLAGDARAFDAFFASYARRLAAFAARRTAFPPASIEDLVQTTLIKAVRNLEDSLLQFFCRASTKTTPLSSLTLMRVGHWQGADGAHASRLSNRVERRIEAKAALLRHILSSWLKDFQIAGADKKFVPAEATIDGDSLIVSADGVADPKAVRYSWSDNPDGNLYNKAGLPASPFRTDDWEP